LLVPRHPRRKSLGPTLFGLSGHLFSLKFNTDAKTLELPQNLTPFNHTHILTIPSPSSSDHVDLGQLSTLSVSLSNSPEVIPKFPNLRPVAFLTSSHTHPLSAPSCKSPAPISPRVSKPPLNSTPQSDAPTASRRVQLATSIKVLHPCRRVNTLLDDFFHQLDPQGYSTDTSTSLN
jgi:hypothetical protein